MLSTESARAVRSTLQLFNLPSYQVREVDDPGQACCLRPHIAHDSVSECTGDKSMETAVSKWVVNQAEPSYDSVHMATCMATVGE